jgi:hypothetical protein
MSKKKQQPRICVECKQPESSTLPIITVILPPTINTRTNFCRVCLSTLIDNDIAKNRVKHREENAAY